MLHGFIKPHNFSFSFHTSPLWNVNHPRQLLPFLVEIPSGVRRSREPFAWGNCKQVKRDGRVCQFVPIMLRSVPVFIFSSRKWARLGGRRFIVGRRCFSLPSGFADRPRCWPRLPRALPHGFPPISARRCRRALLRSAAPPLRSPARDIFPEPRTQGAFAISP